MFLSSQSSAVTTALVSTLLLSSSHSCMAESASSGPIAGFQEHAKGVSLRVEQPSSDGNVNLVLDSTPLKNPVAFSPEWKAVMIESINSWVGSKSDLGCKETSTSDGKTVISCRKDPYFDSLSRLYFGCEGDQTSRCALIGEPKTGNASNVQIFSILKMLGSSSPDGAGTFIEPAAKTSESLLDHAHIAFAETFGSPCVQNPYYLQFFCQGSLPSAQVVCNIANPNTGAVDLCRVMHI